jgi:hypothetical protein
MTLSGQKRLQTKGQLPPPTHKRVTFTQKKKGSAKAKKTPILDIKGLGRA